MPLGGGGGRLAGGGEGRRGRTYVECLKRGLLVGKERGRRRDEP